MHALQGAPLAEFSTYERLRWAGTRETTKREDKTYCLLGIFNIFLPPIYGEGDNAFERLQHELTRKINIQESAIIHPHHDALEHSNGTLASSRMSQQRRRNLLASLEFEQIGTRHATIKNTQRTMCEWLLHHPIYIA